MAEVTIFGQLKDLVNVPIDIVNRLLPFFGEGNELYVVGLISLLIAYYLKKRWNEGVLIMLMIAGALFGFLRFVKIGG